MEDTSIHPQFLSDTTKDDSVSRKAPLSAASTTTAMDSPVSTRPQTPSIFPPSNGSQQQTAEENTAHHPIDLNGLSWPSKYRLVRQICIIRKHLSALYAIPTRATDCPA
ncbi:hypothetical protein H4R20_007041 [Coemansia guatemalensis]|uniref:Uncharacterized protein n=1 Tax=Coemansia guatemalensis TaxID=2761395 RepID=A0A9W8HLN5_9FUNG|nr:hypothetical protein H4R20_007041 [Coemansia guatemalensis]